jgi:hypothetical protein
MQLPINNTTDLRAAIQLLEQRKIAQRELMINKFRETYESFKPVNIIKNEFSKLTGTTDAKSNVLNAAVGIGVGLLSKKLFVGASHNIFKKLFGTAIEMGVAKFVTGNVEKIKNIGLNFLPPKNGQVL